MPWEGDDEANEMETEDLTSTADLSLQDILRVLNKPEKQVALVLFLCVPPESTICPCYVGLVWINTFAEG
jgi:hypothetical protein